MMTHDQLKMIYAGLIFSSIVSLFGQDNNLTISLTRGKLWHSYYLAQECEPMQDWARKTYGLDWPGYRTDQIKQDIGGSYSYLTAGGFALTALTDSGTVWGWDNFATHATTVGLAGAEYRFLISKDQSGRSIHYKKWKYGENYWLMTDPHEAEEVIITQWEINGEWYQPWDNQVVPVKIKRVVRQWSGSMADENYIITEYTLKNTLRRDDLKGIYLLFTFALSPNHRGWNLTMPNLPPGARNTQSYYDSSEKLLVSWAGDFTATPIIDESFDYFLHDYYDPVLKQTRQRPEFLAPGFLGIKFLYISPDSNGVENKINGFAWSAASPSQDHSGPYLGVVGLDSKYEAMANPLLLSEAFQNPQDPRMGQNRLYANFSVGPFNLLRREGDSIKVVMAEFVGGASYEKAIAENVTQQDIKAMGDSAVEYLNERIKFNFEHHYTVPMPPPAPQFSISANKGKVGNVVHIQNSVESIPDPHQGFPDIAGYRIYRSGYLPFGPWEKIADIPVADPRFFQPDSHEYVFIDTLVALGYAYYYSVTSYDNGHSSWAVDPTYVVPPLESSIFANRMETPFYTTLQPQKSLAEVKVVPNPFYVNSGFEFAGDAKLIQFVNLESECTIRIYTLRGDLVKTIYHNNPQSGVTFWNQISDNGQYVKSGMYFYVVTNAKGETQKGKLAIIN